jgi:hypothetical protein
MKNPKNYNYFIDGDISYLYLKNKKGKEFTVIIDTKYLEKVLNYKYRFNPRYHVQTKEYYIKATIYRNVFEKDKQRTIALSRFLLEDKICETDLIDHINGNKLDNRESNFRLTDTSNNGKNRKDRNSNNKTGFRNVCKVGNRLYVQLQIRGINTLLKTFSLDQLEEAGKYAEEMRKEYYGDFSGGN